MNATMTAVTTELLRGDAKALNDMTLPELKEFCRDLLRNGGGKCPCCTQHMKVYRRPLNATIARGMISAYRMYGTEVGHFPTAVKKYAADIAHQGGYLSLGQHWGLLADESDLRPDGGRSGHWRVTELGRAWVLGEVGIPKYSYAYNARCFDLDGPDTTILEALGKKFNYRELMSS